ncbi:MAG TPA: enoyl-CoA hydratase [Gammaproteobacteria bacterium]|nr:enoyl-CoA hydratase [Gammaproteobacteria bacterium]|tara:strand:- start:3847 stop:4611 length:765 start_codon:yes stop_codon:yes gene_type:complete
MENKKIDLQIEGGIGRIILDNPENYNTVDLQFTRELASAARHLEADPSVKVVALAANGPVFSFGGDLREFVAHKERLQTHVREMTVHFHSAILSLIRMPAPVIVAVKGMAAGGGFSLVCMSDMAIAGRSAKFNFAYTRSGLTPDGGATYFLSRLVGPQRAFDIMSTNPTLSAEQAWGLGIIARVFDDDDFEAEFEALLKQLISLPSDALPRLKTLLRVSPSASLEQQFEHEGRSISEIAPSLETIAALESFLQN